MTPEHFTAQKMKKAYYLTQKIPDQVGNLSSLKLPTALSEASTLREISFPVYSFLPGSEVM